MVTTNSPKSSKNITNALFRALMKSLQTIYKPVKSQKLIKHMPVASKYLWKTFDGNLYIRTSIGTVHNVAKTAIMLSLGPFLSPNRPWMDVIRVKNH